MEQQSATADESTWMILSTPHGTYLCRMHSGSAQAEEAHELNTQVNASQVPGNPKAVSISKEAIITPMHVTSAPTKTTFDLTGCAITLLSDMDEVDRDYYMDLLSRSKKMAQAWRDNRSTVKPATVSDLSLIRGR